MTEERNDIAEGNVWPEEPGELGPCPFGEPCTNRAHHELARRDELDPMRTGPSSETRREWRRQKNRYGMDPGLFC